MAMPIHVRMCEVVQCSVVTLQVRAAAVYALGTFINITAERSDHANNIDHGVGMMLITVSQDGSPLVRKVTKCNNTHSYLWLP